MKRILVSYNNRKRHGAHPLLNKTCEGCIASNGQVVLFSDELPRKGYLSISEMKSVLGEYGDVEVDYIDKEVTVTLPDLSLLTKIVLRDLIQNAILEHKVHDLVWYYATTTRDDGTNVETELKLLIDWLEKSEA